MLYVIKKDYFLSDYILEKLREDDSVVVIRFARRLRWPSFVFKIWRFFDVLFDFKSDKTLYFEREFIKQLSCIKEDDSVLFFGVENQKDLTLLSRIIPAKRKTLWMWNPMNTIVKSVIGTGDYGKTLLKHGIDVYTFDQGDAEKYKLNHTYQVYVQDYTIQDVIPKNDIFFVGNDKGRIDYLYELYSQFQSLNLSCYFHVIPSKYRRYDSTYKQILHRDLIPYHKSIELIKESKVVLDILQPNQSGQTLRPLEALFLGRKLITNNRSIVNELYYHPQRIFVLGMDNIETLVDFVNSPFVDVDVRIKEQYEIRTWIERFK